MPEQLKNIFFRKKFIDELAKRIKNEYPKFNMSQFNGLVFDKEWDDRTLKQKMRHVSECLGETLPKDFSQAVQILIKIEKHFGGFDHLTFADFVERFGLDCYDESIAALEVFTRTTSEFAIRPFIQKYPKKTMAQMLKWAKSKKDYVRRLASEGCRPRLPWGMALADFKKDPSPILPILKILKNDPSENVRRSVANNLNDISKDNPDIVIKIAKKWFGESKEIDKIIKHALRGLLKKGNPDAMKLFGYGDVKDVKINELKVEPQKIKIGGVAELFFELETKKKQKLRLEYALEYAKAKGKTSEKIFQIQEATYDAEKKEFRRKLNFMDCTTRKHYPGKHKLTIIVNGNRMAKTEFSLM